MFTRRASPAFISPTFNGVWGKIVFAIMLRFQSSVLFVPFSEFLV